MLKRIFGWRPDRAELFGRETAALFRAAKGRLEKRRDAVFDEIDRLSKEEASLLEEGSREDTPRSRRVALAQQIQEIRRSIEFAREKARRHAHQIKIYTRCAELLETIQELRSEPMPAPEVIEAAALHAKVLYGKLEERVEFARAAGEDRDPLEADFETLAVVRELEELSRRSREKEASSREKREAERAAPPQMEEH